mmetsp:Transcript_15822/g.54705  ORF Transcript_15822/g.54705 Transcript_15822/m.54705 type:complete len:201 (+) Transcript_15822:455-1057(+)
MQPCFMTSWGMRIAPAHAAPHAAATSCVAKRPCELFTKSSGSAFSRAFRALRTAVNWMAPAGALRPTCGMRPKESDSARLEVPIDTACVRVRTTSSGCRMVCATMRAAAPATSVSPGVSSSLAGCCFSPPRLPRPPPKRRRGLGRASADAFGTSSAVVAATLSAKMSERMFAVVPRGAAASRRRHRWLVAAALLQLGAGI